MMLLELNETTPLSTAMDYMELAFPELDDRGRRIIIDLLQLKMKQEETLELRISDTITRGCNVTMSFRKKRVK